MARTIQITPTPTRRNADTVSVFQVRLPTAERTISARSITGTSLKRVTAMARQTSPKPKLNVPTIANSMSELTT